MVLRSAVRCRCCRALGPNPKAAAAASCCTAPTPLPLCFGTLPLSSRVLARPLHMAAGLTLVPAISRPMVRLLPPGDTLAAILRRKSPRAPPLHAPALPGALAGRQGRAGLAISFAAPRSQRAAVCSVCKRTFPPLQVSTTITLSDVQRPFSSSVRRFISSARRLAGCGR